MQLTSNRSPCTQRTQMATDLRIPENVVLDLAPVLRQWIGWFRPADECQGYPYHALRGGEFWNAHTGPHHTWIGCHPYTPRWATETVRAVSPSEPIDAYQGLFLTELVDLLSHADPDEPLEDTLRSFISSPSPLLDDADALKEWLCSSDERGDFLWQAKQKTSGGGNGLLAALAEAQALERKRIAERLLAALTSDQGQFRVWLQVEFEGLADCFDSGTELLREAGRVIFDLDHEDFCRLVQTYERAGLFRPPETLDEGIRHESTDRPVEARLERALARAALTVSLFEPRTSP